MKEKSSRERKKSGNELWNARYTVQPQRAREEKPADIKTEYPIHSTVKRLTVKACVYQGVAEGGAVPRNL